MTETTWRKHLPDLRQMAIWALESGQRVRAKGGRDGRCYRIEVAGSRVELYVNSSVGTERDRCQLHIADMDGNWKGALGFMAPSHLVIPDGTLTEFGAGEERNYDGTVYRPFADEIMERLDRAREAKKTSPGSNQFDVSYFAYWFLIYGEQVGAAMFTNPENPTQIFVDDKMRNLYEGKGIPHTYLNDPTGKFPTAFTLTKLALT